MDTLPSDATTPSHSPDNGRSWFVSIWFLLIGLCATIFFGQQSLEEIRDAREIPQLLEQGLVVDGFIIGTHSEDRDESTVYYASYGFFPAGLESEFTSEQEVNEVYYSKLSPNMRVRVRYLKNSPQVSRLDEGLSPPSFFSILLSFLPLLPSVAFIVFGLISFAAEPVRRYGRVLVSLAPEPDGARSLQVHSGYCEQ